MSKKNGNHRNHTDNMVCPECDGARIMRDQDSDHLLESRTCTMCHGAGQVSRRWLEKQRADLVDRITAEVLGDAEELTIAQAQEITWRVAKALTGGSDGTD